MTVSVLLAAAFLIVIGSLTWYWSRRRRLSLHPSNHPHRNPGQYLGDISKYAHDAILLTDAMGTLIDVNDKALELYGYTREELLGLPLSRLRTVGSLADYSAQWLQTELQNGLVFETEYQHKNGSVFPAEVSARIITKDNQRLRLAIVRDIRARKRTENDITGDRDFYLSLLEIFPNPVWRADIDSMRNYFNQAWLDFTGHGIAQESGNGWAAGVHPDDIDKCIDTYLSAVKDRRPFIMEYRLRHHDGGYRWLADHGRPFFDMHGNFAGYIGSCYDIQQLKTAEEHMEFLANHDSLTRLPNRMLLHDRIERALASARRDGRQVAVLFIDLDRFKEINDALGHAAGDQLLQDFAARLCKCVRDADTVSRLGGDEFIVVIPELREAADAAPIAQKILDAMSIAFSITDKEVRVTPSIGISAFPQDGADAQTLINNADSAMYSAKRRGRNAIQFYTPALYISSHDRLNMEYGLNHALAHGEFELYYQPQIDLRTRRLVGLEALLRWRHPHKGTLLPAQFLPIAESSGQMIPIGRWVLKTACTQCRIWQTGNIAVPVCVNLSAAQFLHQHVVTDISAALRDSDLPANLLSISVTGNALEQAGLTAETILGALHALGIGVTVDDFIAADPPLEQFRLHNIDTFMLHHKYVRNIAHSSDAAAIASAIIDMAHKEDLKVIAEGVETMDQLDLLSSQGCDVVQGYYFSEALPASRLDELLKNRTAFDPSTIRH